jgi:hypothetical protein
MGEQNYGHRRIIDKLGLKPGQVVAVDAGPVTLDAALLADVSDRCGEPFDFSNDAFDVALVGIDAKADPIETLARWKAYMHPDGCIWLLTPKHGRSGYVNQDTELIPAGQAAGLVDNKICSVSETVSAMRFVLRKADRAAHKPHPGMR